jgi:hypothetical protein
MKGSTLPTIIVAVAFAALALSSCTKPSQETASISDSTGTISDSTEEEGNTDGDIFVTPEFQKQRQEEDSIAQAEQERDEDEGDEDRELGPWEDEQMVSRQEAEIDVCGFSNDRKYFAFTQVTHDDMNGGAGAVFVIDVAKNQWASKPARIESFEDFEEIRKKFESRRDSMLKKFDIPYHKSKFVIYDMVDKEQVYIDINQSKYEITFVNDGGKFDVRIAGNGKDAILQKDSKVPASRGTVRRARLHSTYVSGEYIVVFVEYDGDVITGFENYRYYDRKRIAITGKLK